MRAQVHATAAPNSSARFAAVLCVLLMAGCAGITPLPTPAVPPVAASIDTPVATLPASEPPTSGPAVTTVPDVVAAAPASPPTAPPAMGSVRPEPARPATSTSRAPAKPATAPDAAPLAQAQTPAAAAAVAKPPAAPPLDLKSLEARLKETKAIGVFTKLTLKNQVDDLLSQFRDYYQGRLKATLVELRRSYDLLVLKVLALLQDTDPPLAVAIASSRESIWGILSNRAKFAAV